MLPRQSLVCPHRSLHKRLALIATLLAALASTAQALDYYKANNTTTLTSAASWWLDAAGTTAATDAPTNNTSPTAVCIWNNLVPAAQSLSIPDVGIQTLRILNPGGPITLDGTASPRTVTVGNGGGIDMSQATQDLTLTNCFYRLAAASASIGLNVATGRTLTFGANAKLNVRNNSSGTTVNINPDGVSKGTVIFSADIAPSNVVVNAGLVQFNSATGSTRLSTNATTVNGGTLLVNNTSGSATGSGAVAVNSTATLGGTGIITGAVTANAGSILSPGSNGIGTLTLGSLTLTADSAISWEANNSADADRIAVTASNGLTINGGVIHLYNPGTSDPFSGTGLYTLFSYSGAIGGTGISSLSVAESSKIAGRTYTISIGAGVVTLRIATASATAVYWNTDTSGNWSTALNWTGGSVPDAIGAIAQITGSGGATFTAPRTVTLDAPRTVGTLVLDSTQIVTVDGSSALTLNDGGAAATLNSSGANHVISAPLSLTTGGILASVESAGNQLTLSGAVSGVDVGIVKTGAGTLLLTANNPYTGATSVASGTLQIGNGGTTGSVGGAIATSGIVRFNRADPVTLAFPISGTGSVEFTGSGTTTLSVANTYSGATTLAAGSLVLANSLALQSSTLNYSTTGGTLTVADPVAAITLGGLSGDRAFPLTNSLGTAIALTVGGNNASTTYSGSPLGTGASLTKTGSGTLTLTGTHNYSGATTVSAGVLGLNSGASLTTTAANTATNGSAKILVNGGTLTASAASTISNVTAGLAVAGGTANFNAGIANETGSSSGNPFISVTGGTLNASSISLSRGGLSITGEPTNGQTANGLYVNGGAVNVAGALGIGAIAGSNSSVSARIDSGSLTVAGPLTVGINNIGRWSVLDVAGGTLTSNDTVTGIQLGSAFDGNVIMFTRNSGSVVKAQRIQLGQGAFAGTAKINLGGGNLYVGSGGITVGSTNSAFVSRLTLAGGKLGATADWSSTVPITISGGSFTAADENNVPHTITLGGSLSGSGTLLKNGSGSVIFTAPGLSYSGPIAVDAGTLGIGGTIQDITVAAGATLAPQGELNATFGATINGALAISYNSASALPVPRLIGDGITLDSGSTLKISGTGVLPGPAYVIARSSSGAVNGTFGTVTGIPAGFTLNYNYDDGSGIPAIALVGSGVASPYDTWAASYSLSGSNALASADPDGDGLVNQLEYALGTSPVASDSGSAYTLGRSGNFLTLTFNHPADSTLTYAIEASNDLTGAWTVVNTFAPFTTAATVTYTDTVNITTTPKRFLRLKVTPPAP